MTRKQIEKWLARNTSSLLGKTVAITGSTGGLGRAICQHLITLGADLILLDRNILRSQEHANALMAQNPRVSVRCIPVDMEDIDAVKRVCDQLSRERLDCLILNAGAYSIPRKVCSTGYLNVFQINFVSPYYMSAALLPSLAARNGRVIAVGSIAHRYSAIDPEDVDFSSRKAASKVYGNAKRYLMFALYSLFEREERTSLSVVHPGITFTNITAHYPKLIFAVIKHPMKVLFMRTDKAALSVIKGIFDSCERSEWIGPRFFDIWGLPQKRWLHSCFAEEQSIIVENAERILASL